jgi:Rrf2 family protein
MELIRRKADYALRCLVNLAEAGQGAVVSVHTLAQKEKVPEDLLQKIMQALAAAGLVLPRRGRSGGFSLNKAPDQLNMLDVLETLQGPFAINRCFLGEGRCRHQDVCWLRNKLRALQDEMISFFRGVTISDLVREDKELTETS